MKKLSASDLFIAFENKHYLKIAGYFELFLGSKALFYSLRSPYGFPAVMRTLPLSLGGITKFFLIKADILHFLLHAIARYGFENERYSHIYAFGGALEIARTSLSCISIFYENLNLRIIIELRFLPPHLI